MARASLLSILCGPVAAVLLLAGCGAPDEVVDAGAVGQPAEEGTPAAEETVPAEDDDSGTRPGAPFDIEAFENIGGPLDSFRDSVASTCGGGACTVTEVITETVDAPEGCSVDSFEYDPPAQPEGAEPSEQFIQRGTSVTAHISCPPEEGGEGEGEVDGEGEGEGEGDVEGEDPG